MGKGGKGPWNKGKISLRFCFICKKQVFPNKQRMYTKTCSEACKKRLMSIRATGRVGEKSSHWKGGIERKHSGSDRIQRIIFRNEIQKLVFERDNYTCQICGARGADLQVDHIQSWAEYIELRFKIDNCRTLCAKCHYKITFGRPMPDNIKGWGHNLFKGEVLGL